MKKGLKKKKKSRGESCSRGTEKGEEDKRENFMREKRLQATLNPEKSSSKKWFRF